MASDYCKPREITLRLETPYQQGNDQADKIAKRFMSGAEKMGPVPYFIKAEERFLASHGDTLVGGNIRMWLKGRVGTTRKCLKETQSSRSNVSTIPSTNQESHKIGKKLVDRKDRWEGMDLLHLCCL